MLKYVWPKFEILTTYISQDTVHCVENLTINFTQKLLLHFYGFLLAIHGAKQVWETKFLKRTLFAGSTVANLESSVLEPKRYTTDYYKDTYY